MHLTTLRPDLSQGVRDSGFHNHPDYLVELVPIAKRVRALVGGEAVADSTAAMLMRETGHLPVYYFPRADVRMALVERTAHHTH